MKIKKLCCILIPELTNKYWLFILFIIGSLFRKMIPSILSDYIFKLRKTNIEYQEERREIFFDIICNVASDLFTGILHCISGKYTQKKPNKSKNEKKSNVNNKKELKIKFIFNDMKIKKLFKYKIIIVISIIDFICQILFFGNCTSKKKFNDEEKSNVLYNPDFLYSFLVIDIISRYIFSSLILKTYFYNHHYLSFVLNLIGLSILFYIDIRFKIKKYTLIYILLIILQYILYSLEDIINKVALIDYFFTPEALLFYKGLFSFVYLSVFTLLLFFFDPIQFPSFDKTLLSNIFCRLYYIVFNIIRSVFLVKVIEFFSSQHISFLRVLETIVLFIYYSIDSKYKNSVLNKKDNNNGNNNNNIYDNYFHLKLPYELIEVGAFIILLFSTLIHNEIIIINLKRYKTHTKYFMQIEAEEEGKTTPFKEEENEKNIENDASIENTQTISSINEINLSNTNSF